MSPDQRNAVDRMTLARLQIGNALERVVEIFSDDKLLPAQKALQAEQAISAGREALGDFIAAHGEAVRVAYQVEKEQQHGA